MQIKLHKKKLVTLTHDKKAIPANVTDKIAGGIVHTGCVPNCLGQKLN